MPLKPLVFLLFALTCFNTPSVWGRTRVRVNETRADTTSRMVLIENNVSTGSHEKGFFSRLKHKVASFMFKKQHQSEEKGSTKATLGWVSLGLILLGFLSVGSSLTVVTLLAGIVTGIVSLAMRDNKTEINKKKRRNLPAIIALSLVLIAVIAFLIFLSFFWK